jgi:Zn-dependent peptidase ImmA (M78 family)
LSSVRYISDSEISDVIRSQVVKAYPTGFRLPFNVEEFTEVKLNVPLQFIKLPKHILGHTDFEKNIISINKYLEGDQHIHRLRFTIAHELGHFSLHREFIHNGEKFLNQEETIQLYTKNESRLESQANQYAGMLLIPWIYLDKIYEKIEADLKSEDRLTALSAAHDMVCTVEKDCLVSPQCARIRLKNYFKTWAFSENF